MAEKNKKILIVEDEIQLAFILKQSLEFNNFTVTMVHTVEDGIEILTRENFNCVVSDYYLPQQSGEELFKYITDNSISVPFIFMTGSPSLDFAVSFLKKGGAEYISKPFNLNDFVNKVKEVIQKFEKQKTQAEYFGSLQQKLAERVKEITIYQDVFNSSGDGVFIMGLNQKIVKFNPALEKITGFKDTELFTSMQEIFRPTKDYEEKFTESILSLENDGSWQGELELLNKSGKPYFSYLTLSEIYDENKSTFAYMCSVKDVTELKLMEKNLLQSLQKTNIAQEAIIFGMAKLSESRDPETGGHLERIRSYCQLIANKLKENKLYPKIIDDDFIEALYITAPLHDIGKVGIPDNILLKKGKLTEQEYELMKQHTIIGAETLQAIAKEFGGIDYLRIGIDIAIAHHEKWDGTGYPYQLKNTNIPLAARILAIADVYDALTTKRVYKRAVPHEETLEMMMENRGKHFDPELLDIFYEIEEESLKIKQLFD